MMENNDAFNAYVMVEMVYQKMFNNQDKDKIYPFNWYSIFNYELKIKILSEAIEKKILIKDTDEYKKFMN